MVEMKSEAKRLYDLAKALGRWDNEGGAGGSPPGMENGPDITLPPLQERILQYLGAAVIMRWNDLPTDIQRYLFDDAASMGTPARRFQLKQQIAQFLHDHKDDAGDS
jgi:hypothetical protein